MLTFGDLGDSGVPNPSNTPVEATDDESTEDELDSTRAPRPTKKNPFHGLVEGVKRGNTKYSEFRLFFQLHVLKATTLDIVRVKPLPAPYPSTAECTRRFNRVMQD